ncbi:hypothetical protein EDF71_11598 [Comamonas sp. JUb58]|nr:hypothetical protein EDF71_11598 [Comamonas sp. JUb58]
MRSPGMPRQAALPRFGPALLPNADSPARTIGVDF